MQFIQAKNEKQYAAAKMVSIGPNITRHGEWLVDVEIEGEGTVEFYGHRIEALLRQPVTSFAAEAGTYVIHIDDEEDGAFFKVPVIGWAISRDAEVYPITPEGVNDGVTADCLVLTPDGRVTEKAVCTHENIEAFFKAKASMAELAAQIGVGAAEGRKAPIVASES